MKVYVMMQGRLSMRTGQNNFKFVRSNKPATNCIHFMGLVTIRNGTITEEMSPESKIFEKYVVGIGSDDWGVLVENTIGQYVPIAKNSGHIINHINLKLTTKDKEEMEIIRDLYLSGSKGKVVLF